MLSPPDDPPSSLHLLWTKAGNQPTPRTWPPPPPRPLALVPMQLALVLVVALPSVRPTAVLFLCKPDQMSRYEYHSAIVSYLFTHTYTSPPSYTSLPSLPSLIHLPALKVTVAIPKAEVMVLLPSLMTFVSNHFIDLSLLRRYLEKSLGKEVLEEQLVMGKVIVDLVTKYLVQTGLDVDCSIHGKVSPTPHLRSRLEPQSS